MQKFYCECCDYNATTKQSLQNHNKTKKHMTKAKECGKYPCDYCGTVFGDRMRKWRHMQKCTDITEIDKLKKAVKKNENDDVLLEKLIDMATKNNQSNSNKDDVVKKSLEIAGSAVETSLTNAKNTGKSMNMMKYAMVHFKDAPPLLSLDPSQVHQMLEYDQKDTNKPRDEINSDYIMPLLYNYENKVLDEFFGNFIVNFFNTEEMKDRKFWTSDVSRLSFIIMQVVNKKGEKEWNHDKTGKKFIDLVIDPMFEEVVKLLDEFVNNKQKWIDENFGKVYIAPSKMTQLMHVQQLAKELQLDIKYNKFTTDILKFVAPHFNFDSVRMAEEKATKVLSLKQEEKPIKQITTLKSDLVSIKPKKVTKNKTAQK
jgi:hypothetical protein